MANAKKPGDVTGNLREKLQKDAIEEQQSRAAEITLATAQAQVALETEVIDATEPKVAEVVIEETTVISADDESVVIRVVEDIDAMNFGAGNYFSFRAGQKYKVTKALANHLMSKGYLSNSL
ncbi:MAG: hypothetical protein EBZ77_06125 [Chitinophagia bacterium]|nr:hypothetical protein [Chitinophagia bacterium]